MAYLIFHYSSKDSFIWDDPRKHVGESFGEIVAVYDDGKIVTKDIDAYGNHFNEKVVCNDINVVNKITEIIENNRLRIFFIPKELGFWGFDGSCDSVWLKNKHYKGINFLVEMKYCNNDRIKEMKNDGCERKYLRLVRRLMKFYKIYKPIRDILIQNGVPEKYIIS